MKCLLLILAFLLISCAAEEFHKEEGHIDLEGNMIHFKKEGLGPKIFFAHGGYLSLDMWDAQAVKFQTNYQVIRFSDIGHGESKGAKTTPLGSDIIDQLLETKEGEKVTLVGLSWGAMLCVDYVLRFPEKVEKLVLVSPGLNGWDYFQDSLAAKNYLMRKEASEMGDTMKAAELFHKTWVLGPRRGKQDIDPEFYEHSLDMIHRTMRNHWKADWSQLDSIPARQRLEEIKVPTQIIIGDQDAHDIAMIASEYEARIPGSKKIVLAGLAHLLPMEDTEKFNQVLSEVLLQ